MVAVLVAKCPATGRTRRYPSVLNTAFLKRPGASEDGGVLLRFTLAVRRSRVRSPSAPPIESTVYGHSSAFLLFVFRPHLPNICRFLVENLSEALRPGNQASFPSGTLGASRDFTFPSRPLYVLVAGHQLASHIAVSGDLHLFLPFRSVVRCCQC